jgi:hypothetical protein
MRSPAFALAIALLAASCGSGEDPNGSAGDVSEAELAARIENVAFAPTPEEEEKAAPRRLGLLEEATLPDEFRTGRSCRLTEGANLILVAAAFGAVANIDGRSARLAHAGPVGGGGAGRNGNAGRRDGRRRRFEAYPALRGELDLPRLGQAYLFDLVAFFGSVAVPFSLIAIPAGAGQFPVQEDEDEDDDDEDDDDEAGTTAVAGFLGPDGTPCSLIAIGLPPWAPWPP